MTDNKEYRQTLEVLRNLVEALDDTYWTSWQSTDRFDEAHKEARAYLLMFDEKYKYE